MFLSNLFHYIRFHQLKDFKFVIIFFYLGVTLVGKNLSFSITQLHIRISKLLLFHLLNNLMFPHLHLQHVQITFGFPSCRVFLYFLDLLQKSLFDNIVFVLAVHANLVFSFFFYVAVMFHSRH